MKAKSGLFLTPFLYTPNRDDCWEAPNRTADGRLIEDPDKFPSGLKALGDFLKSLGLKFGIVSHHQ